MNKLDRDRHTEMSTQDMEAIQGRPFFCSWSGGKDSALAFYHALRKGGIPKVLLTMMAENGLFSRSHGLRKSLLEQQASSLGVPIVFRSATWDGYEDKFSAVLCDFRAEGIESGVFGDIDVERNREWGVRLCEASGLRAYHPLWKRPRRELLEELVRLGFRAKIVVTEAGRLGPEWLGRTIDEPSLRELEQTGVDASGELGEYHTVVTDGPIFRSNIQVEVRGQVLHEGYWFLELT